MDSGEVEPIAIVGLAGTFPYEQTTADEFWEALCRGDSAWGPIPKERFDAEGFYHPNRERLDSINCKNGYFLKHSPYQFDAQFFRISPAEAAAMDPQQRGIMECTFRALENAGITMNSVAASDTSCFVAHSSPLEYPMLITRDPQLHSKYEAVGGGTTMLANRLSYFFDLRGPSMTLDTACSSSLYALHLGCQSLRSRESRISIIAASNLVLGPEGSHLALSNGGFLSDDGVARCFDEGATGYARGEGYTVLVIKALKHAIADGDLIRSVIRSTAVNASGRSLSLTQPSSRAQADLIRKAYDIAGLDITETQYFEAHSTGTRVGDPIEARAIGAAFKMSREGQNPLLVGSVKANIGHLEAASGLASVIKAVYMQEHGLVPPNINLSHTNPAIDTECLGIELPLKLRPWPTEGVRRISINNFGFGGANAHAILDDARTYLSKWSPQALGRCLPTPQLPTVESRGLQEILGQTLDHPHSNLLVISASDEAGLGRQLDALRSYVQSRQRDSPQWLDDIAFTLSEKRNKLQWRSYITVGGVHDIGNAITSESIPRFRESGGIEIDFIFTGQGAHWCMMGNDLLCFEQYRMSLDQANDHLRSLGCQWSVRDELSSNDPKRLGRPDLSQPLCTILQVALVELLSTWRMKPRRVVGHSSGEIAAAYTAGAITKQTAWSLAYYRGLSIFEASCSDDQTQSMLAVGLSPAEGKELLTTTGVDSHVFIACVNSPSNITLSGETFAIEKIMSVLEKRGTFAKQLPVACAYHTSYMDPATIKYKERIEPLFSERLVMPESSVQIFSSLEGHLIPAEGMSTADYWVRNLRCSVQFCDAVTELVQSRDAQGKRHAFVEIGPHPALKSYVTEILEGCDLQDQKTYLWLLRRNSNDPHAVQTAGLLWARGFNVDVTQVNCSSLSRKPRLLVDFPQYQFNHEQEHRLRSRLVDAVSYHSRTRHEYLGTPDANWNPRKPSWRNVIRIDELPWTRDHGFGDTAVYPAAGYLVMALEGCRQLVGNDEIVTGYRFRNVVWEKALQLDEQTGTEVRIYLERCSDVAAVTDVWFDFWIYGITEGEWAGVCHGGIRAEREHDTVSGQDQNLAEHYRRVSLSSFQVHHQHFYRNLRSMGIQYGPAFSLLRNLKYSKTGQGCGTLSLAAEGGDTDSLTRPPLMAHPTALDAFIHMPLVVLSEGSWKKMPPVMVTRLDEMWLSASLLEMTEEPAIVSTQLTNESLKDRSSNVTAVDPRTELPLIVAHGLTGTALQSFSEAEAEQKEEYLLEFSTKWLPDLTSNSKEDIQLYFDKKVPYSNPEIIDKVDQMIYQYIKRGLQESPEKSPDLKHLQRYLRWMNRAGTRSASQPDSIVETGVEIEEPVLRLINMVGVMLPHILSGDIDPLQLLFEDSSVIEDFYLTVFKPSAQSLHDYFDLLAHENPNLNFLEVGAGTGFASRVVIGSLSGTVSEREATTRFSSYVYTDVSSAFFEHAKSLFPAQKHCMDFQVLDVSQDPVGQGFAEESFDVVLAAAVIHATPNLRQSLQNLCKLLKPGGKLVMVEQSGPRHLISDFIFGVLPGWWLAEEDWRQESPLITQGQWDCVLKESGFTGVELAIKDSLDDRNYFNAVLISHKVDSNKGIVAISSREIRILHDSRSPLQLEIAVQLKQSLSKMEDTVCTLDTLEGDTLISSNSTTSIISLTDLDGDVLGSLSKERFSKLQSALFSAGQILWATSGSSIIPTNPEISKVEGFSRALCSERTDLTFSVIALEDHCNPNDIVNKLVRFVESMHGQMERLEPMYAEKDGILQISRIVPRTLTENWQPEHTSPAKLERVDVPCRVDAPIPAYLDITSAGLLDTLYFRELIPPLQDFARDEIEVEVKFSSLNFKDVLIAMGQVPTKYLGSDGAGIVSKAGIESGFKVGDRVCFFASPGIATVVRCKSHDAIMLPERMDLSTAAALPVVFTTAYHSLYSVAMLKPEESILIHSAAGGVGQCAVQIAQLLGAEVYVTAGTPQKRAMLNGLYSIPGSHIFSSRDYSFAPGILAATHGRGVDVVLNCLTGDLLQASFDLLAPLGRFIEIGKRDVKNASKLVMSAFDKNVSFAAVDLSVIWKQDRSLFSTVFKEAMAFLESNLNSLPGPRPLHTFPAKDATQALRTLQSGKVSGKVLVSFDSSENMPPVTHFTSSLTFTTNATYVISGGFGGIGRSIIYWMIERGAKHVVVLSRSSHLDDPATRMLFQHAETHAAEIVPVICNIANTSELELAVKHLSSGLPPIKGCFQAAMVVKDSLFHKMSFEDFLQPFPAKVEGSWNLHAALPADLDFFIMLSSYAGCCGAPAQTNYAAANTYQDALARYRVARNQKAFSFNLGLVLGAGYAAENFEVTAALERIGNIGVTERQVLDVLERLCDPNLPLPAPEDSQIGVGITLPRDFRKAGKDLPGWLGRKTFNQLYCIQKKDGNIGGSGDGRESELENLAEQVKTAEDILQATQVVLARLRKKVAAALDVPETELNADHSLSRAGVDSLLAVELRTWFLRTFRIDMAVNVILSEKSILELSGVAVKLVRQE